MNPSKIDINNAEDENLATNADKRQKSLPKFNRKGDARILQKKRSIDTPNSQHRISYISPGKNIGAANLNQNASGIDSPTFQNVMHKFSVTSDDLLKCHKSTTFNNDYGFPTCDKGCASEQCKRVLLEKDDKYRLLKSKLEKIKEKYDLQKQQFQALRLKSKQFDQIHVFLLERESFIAQIMETNIGLNESIMKKENQMQSLNAKYQQALKDKDILRQRYDDNISQLTKRLKSQSQEIQKIVLLNEGLQSKFAIKKKNDKKSNRKIKQNNENFDKANIKKARKKSVQLEIHGNNQKTNNQFASHDLNITQQSTLRQGVIQKTAQIEQTYSKIQEEQRILNNHSGKQNEGMLISNLQQRIKYSQIEIDVLKKMKLDSSKIAIDNKCLKFQNRKLLNRISYLTRTFSRRDHSDSSLQLSLSPKEK